jgi:hypothetical protein
MADSPIKPKPHLIWEAPEFIHYPKNKIWIVGISILGLGLIAYFAFQKDFLTTALLVLFFVVILYFGNMAPKTVNVEISPQGVKLNTYRLPFQQIKTFWIVYDPPYVKTLNFETTARFNRFLTVQLMDQDPTTIRSFLLEFLPEDADRGEQFSDIVSRTLKF